MKKIIVVLSIVSCVGFQCLSLDPFIFVPTKVTAYSLPGNTISTLQNPPTITPEKFVSGQDTIYGYYVKSMSLTAPHKQMTVLFLHGNTGNIDNNWRRFQLLHQLGMNLFIIDYKGYGRSTGSSKNDQSMFDDADAAVKFLETSKGVKSDSVILYGMSLGCVPAFYLAVDQKDNKKFPLLIAEVPFASANSLTQTGSVMPIPNGWLNQTGFDNASRARKVTIPTTVIGALLDSTSRFRDNAQVVYNNLTQLSEANSKKRLLTFNTGHSWTIWGWDTNLKTSETMYIDNLSTWINNMLRK